MRHGHLTVVAVADVLLYKSIILVICVKTAERLITFTVTDCNFDIVRCP